MSDPLPVSRKRRRTDDPRDARQGSFECQVCNRHYDRADHLERHLDSHRNERPFRCDSCPAAFNRRDLLLRHQAAHERNAAQGQVGPNHVTERAVKACDACVRSKVKCENARPCQRCTKKAIPCTTKSLTSAVASLATPNEEEWERADPPLTPSSHVSAATTNHNTTPTTPGVAVSTPVEIPAATANHETTRTTVSTPMEISGAQTFLGMTDTPYQQSRRVPTFFDQIMVPEHDFVRTHLALAPDLTMWMPETDWLGEVNLFSNDFGPTIDQTFDTQQILDNFFAPSAPRETPAPQNRAATDRGDEAKRRSAIFKQSPWLWVPARNQHAFSEHDGITIDARDVDIATSPHDPCSSNLIISDSLSQGARDRIFQLVSKTAQSRIIIPSFPSADCLDKLIKVGIAKRMEADAWIHPYTFDSESSRLELLVALIAAGCVCFGVPSVNRTGLVLQEIVRVALQNLVERDNSAFRDLQYLQASMIWLDIGAFCGYRRKMEIAESSLLQLVTAMRRAGKYDKVAYKSIVPDPRDSSSENERKWHEWVELESYKRLAYHLFEHDLDMTMVKHRNPLHSYSEMSVPMPYPCSVWLAPSAEVWRSRMLSIDANIGVSSLRDFLKDDTSTPCFTPAADAQVARSVYLHGLAAQIWELSQQRTLINEDSDPASQLWLRSRHQKLYHLLQNLSLPQDSTPAGTRVLRAFLQMYLHVSVDNITRFAGKCGEEEAHRAYILLQPWSQTKDARIAIYCAGQVLGAARDIPNYQVRGPEAFMIHHSIMVLWTYGMMIQDRARKTGTNTPVPPLAPLPLPERPVFVDAPPWSNSTDVDAFIQKGIGAPWLAIESASKAAPDGGPWLDYYSLETPSKVMKVGVELLEATHPDVERQNGPPLLRALCNLMEGLGNLR